MIVACRPQVPTETAAHATAQQALTKISIGGQSADSTAAYWRCAELVHVCRKCPPHFLRADLMGPWGQIQESQHFLHSHPACRMEAGVRTASRAEISKAIGIKSLLGGFWGFLSHKTQKKSAFSRQSCLFLPNEIDSKNLSSAGAVAEEAIRSQMNFCGVSMCWGSYPPWVLRSGTPPWSYPPKQKKLFLASPTRSTGPKTEWIEPGIKFDPQEVVITFP